MDLNKLLASASTEDHTSLEDLATALFRQGYGIPVKLFIPETGSSIKLLQDWEFNFHPSLGQNYQISNFYFKLETDYQRYTREEKAKLMGLLKEGKLSELEYDAEVDKISVANYSFSVSFPKDTLLKIKKIKLRSSNKGESNLIFFSFKAPKKITLVRPGYTTSAQTFDLCVKISEVNKAICEIISKKEAKEI